MQDKIKILYIDDEMNNLIGFKASFRMEYQVFIAHDIAEAYQHLEKQADIKVVFCDQRMPVKTGSEFFEEMRALYPLPIRILLTGFADIEAVIDAINRGNVFKYVKKPWIEADIISAIKEGVTFYETSSMLSIKNKELQKAYSELDKFAYSVSHDLRGPLVGIRGGIDLALESGDMEEIKDILRLMNKSLVNLDAFILNMHDYYSLERGELKVVSIDFQKVINEIRDTYKIYTLSKSIVFNLSLQQNSTFWSDEISLKLILNNLITNAFKYQRKENPHQMVNLDISVSKGLATIKVTDNGCGIDDKYKNQVYDLFFRAHFENSGSGFGLFNVKSALLKLNGKIEMESEVNKGTTFTVTIPNK